MDMDIVRIKHLDRSVALGSTTYVSIMSNSVCQIITCWSRTS